MDKLYKTISREDFIKISLLCKSKSEFKRKLGLGKSDWSSDKLNKMIIEYNADVSHFNVKNTLNKICLYCNSEFAVNDNKHGRSKKFCSKSCGCKSRIVSDETKRKISEKNTKYKKFKIDKLCPECENEFIDIVSENNDGRTFCCRRCAGKYSLKNAHPNGISDETKRKLSDGRKKLFKEGKVKVTGGKTKWYTVSTSNGDIRVQGTYEVRTCKILDEWKLSNKIKNWEYTNDRVAYVWEDGSNHMYLLDFKVFENDGSFYYIEPKGYIREHDREKWDSVNKRGYKLEVWFKETIEHHERILWECSSD